MSFCSGVAAAGALLVLVLLIFINFSVQAAQSAGAAAQPIASNATASAPVIVVGFVADSFITTTFAIPRYS